MAAKQLLFDEEARRNIRNGIKKLADAVRVTMGPTGRNVILEKAMVRPLLQRMELLWQKKWN